MKAIRKLGDLPSELRRSATIARGDRSMLLYVQGSGIRRTIYSGKVGGAANNSVVVRDENGVILRKSAWPPINYEVVLPRRNVRSMAS
jgi:hypothetical protein